MAQVLLEESDGPAQRGAHAQCAPSPQGSRDPTREK